MRRYERLGFTLMELVVVIAILSILISISVVAVNKTRQAAARVSCQNNLKQIGIALHGFHAIKNRFPAAYRAEGMKPGWGWGTSILPYLDQPMLHAALGVDSSNPKVDVSTAERRLAFARTPLAIYRCPSDSGPALNPMRSNLATSNYRAVSGPKSFPRHDYVPDTDMGGVMYQNSEIRLNSITDGASNTFCVGECMYDKASKKRAAIWVGMRGHISELQSIWLSDVMWCVDDASSTINGPAPQSFSSNHTGGAFFLFCDGSVRFASEGADPSIMKFLAGREDGVNLDIAAFD